MMDNETPDEALMQRVTRGDTEAFDLLFQRHQRSVYYFILRMTGGDASLTEDIAQECFLRLWRARQTYRPTSAALRTYLFTIARRLVLDVTKQQQRRAAVMTCGETGEAVATEQPGRADPQTMLMGRELERVLLAALDALPPTLREVVLLRDMEGLRYEEIAAITGCPLGTVKSRLSSARQRLKTAAQHWLREEKE